MLHNQPLALLMLGSPIAMRMAPELHPDVPGVRKKFQITNFTMPNNLSSMKKALKSIPGLADVEVSHGDGDGPRAPPKCLGAPENFQITNFTRPNNISSMNYALK